MREIKYIKDEVFQKLSKKEKKALPESSHFDEVKISKLVIIPTNNKNDGYCIGQFFAYTEKKGWWKPMSYDCWQINTDIENPATIRYGILKGDFENGGFNIFSFIDEHHNAYISYGGQITIRKKLENN
mgnify:CR=1 FL=1